jgi:hypothetical protein
MRLQHNKRFKQPLARTVKDKMRVEVNYLQLLSNLVSYVFERL